MTTSNKLNHCHFGGTIIKLRSNYAPNLAGHNKVLNWIRIKVTNKLIVKLMLIMLMSILKTTKNLLRKILPQ